MSFNSKDDATSGVQLKVQELVVKMSDTQVLTTSANNATIDVHETIGEIRCALFVDDSAPSVVTIPASSRTVSGTQVTLALGAAMTAADCIILEYVILD